MPSRTPRAPPLLQGSKVLAKKELAYVPIIGWMWYFTEMVFCTRKWEHDRKTVARGLLRLRDYPEKYFVREAPAPARAPRGAHGPGPSCPLTSPRRHAHARSGCSHTCTYTRVHTYTLRVLLSHADAHTRTLRVLVTHMHIHTRAHIQTQDAHLTRTHMPMRAHAHTRTHQRSCPEP